MWPYFHLHSFKTFGRALNSGALKQKGQIIIIRVNSTSNHVKIPINFFLMINYFYSFFNFTICNDFLLKKKGNNVLV